MKFLIMCKNARNVQRRKNSFLSQRIISALRELLSFSVLLQIMTSWHGIAKKIMMVPSAFFHNYDSLRVVNTFDDLMNHLGKYHEHLLAYFLAKELSSLGHYPGRFAAAMPVDCNTCPLRQSGLTIVAHNCQTNIRNKKKMALTQIRFLRCCLQLFQS